MGIAHAATRTRLASHRSHDPGRQRSGRSRPSTRRATSSRSRSPPTTARCCPASAPPCRARASPRRSRTAAARACAWTACGGAPASSCWPTATSRPASHRPPARAAACAIVHVVLVLDAAVSPTSGACSRRASTASCASPTSRRPSASSSAPCAPATCRCRARCATRSTRRASHPREREILLLVVAGLSNAEIAGRLYLAPSTVAGHVRNIFRRLGVHSRADAAKLILTGDESLRRSVLAVEPPAPGVVERGEPPTMPVMAEARVAAEHAGAAPVMRLVPGLAAPSPRRATSARCSAWCAPPSTATAKRCRPCTCDTRPASRRTSRGSCPVRTPRMSRSRSSPSC